MQRGGLRYRTGPRRTTYENEPSPIHLLRHFFWVTATDGAAIPETARWPETTVLVHVGSSRNIELIADNPGDWPIHCHMFNELSGSVHAGTRRSEGGQSSRVTPRLHVGMIEVEYSGSDGCPLYASIVSSVSSAPPMVLLHGGGPDHRMFLPLARELADLRTVILPDVRGYGRSVCADPSLHTWSRYADDVVALLNHLGVDRAVVGGAGLGATISLRTAVEHSPRVEAAVLISVEDIEDDEKKAEEVEFMNSFAARVRERGIEAAWESILPDLAPLIGSLVRDAIHRSDPESIAAAAAIGRDRSFRGVEDVSGITAPVLIFGGMDYRHPRRIAEALAQTLPYATLSSVTVDEQVRSAEDLARVFAPEIREFLRCIG